MKRKFLVNVVTQVEVILDDEVINDEFNKEFSRYFWEAECLEDHAKYIAEMKATGRVHVDNFIEGYGNLREIGCSANDTESWIDDIEEEDMVQSTEE